MAGSGNALVTFLSVRMLVALLVVLLLGCQSVADHAGYAFGESQCKKSFVYVDSLLSGDDPRNFRRDISEKQTAFERVKAASERGGTISDRLSGIDNRPSRAPVVREVREVGAGEGVGSIFVGAFLLSMANGYELIGSCEFLGEGDQGRFSKVHAENIGADVVWSFYSHFDKNFVSSRDGGYSYNTYKWAEIFFRKVPEGEKDGLFVQFLWHTHLIGISVGDLNDAQRREMRRNTGAVIVFVVPGSPAFMAELQVGDVIVFLDGVAITSREDFQDQMKKMGSPADVFRRVDSDEVIDLQIFRGGRLIDKSLRRGVYRPGGFP